MRRLAGALSLALAAAASHAQAPRFEDAVGYELYQLVRAGDVALSSGGAPQSPGFYSDKFNQLEEVRCEHSTTFGLVARANQTGNILVAVCERESGRVRALARDARRGLSETLGELRKSGARIDEAGLAKAGWTYQRVDAADGEEHHFPVLLIGHGILGPQTMVYSPRGDRRVIVIQADLHRHCENYGLGATPLCANTRTTLAQLGRRILARIPRQ